MPLTGTPLSSGLRFSMEARFQTSFDRVVVHDGPEANALARRLGARAFTVGPHIFFADRFIEDIALLAHELTHVVQCGNATPAFRVEPSDSPVELEAQQVSARVAAGFQAGPIRHSLRAIARNNTSEAVKKLLSYGVTDWEVNPDEERQILTLLSGDTSPVNTFNDLKSAGMLQALIERVDGEAERVELMQVLGAKLDDACVDVVLPLVLSGTPDYFLFGFLLNVSHDLQAKFRALGLTNKAPAFNMAALSYVIGKSPTAAFSGVGATGVNPSKLPKISIKHKAGMVAGIESIRKLYHNPLGDLGTYLSSLTPQERTDQATLLLRQPISSIVPHSYFGNVPSRADVIKAAAAAYNLHGAAVAAFLLAEQRDQTSNEDAKDYQAGVTISNTSIGLGQVVISTAKNNDLFSDLLREKVRKELFNHQIAMLLASDEFNIFAAAKYIRKTATTGAGFTAARLPNTVSRWPNVDFPKYAQNSRNWPDDNIAALGAEYTSTPWDDKVSAWGDFVLEAYRDIVASGVF